jgi:hypothetical protein
MVQSTLSMLATDVFVPSLAPLVILAFLGAALLLVCAALGAGVAAAARRFHLAKAVGGAGLAVAVVYSTLLLAAALFSRDRTLAPGERKYFCEMDCHLAYDVASAAAPDTTTRVVTVRTWFDPATIASFRGDAPLSPNPRTVWLVDEAGRRYAPSDAATQAWEKAHGGSSTPLDRPLRPGESYTTTFVFTLPPEARGPRLFIGNTGGPESFLINHENSLLHGKIYFALPAPIAAEES